MAAKITITLTSDQHDLNRMIVGTHAKELELRLNGTGRDGDPHPRITPGRERENLSRALIAAQDLLKAMS